MVEEMREAVEGFLIGGCQQGIGRARRQTGGIVVSGLGERLSSIQLDTYRRW